MKCFRIEYCYVTVWERCKLYCVRDANERNGWSTTKLCINSRSLQEKRFSIDETDVNEIRTDTIVFCIHKMCGWCLAIKICVWMSERLNACLAIKCESMQNHSSAGRMFLFANLTGWGVADAANDETLNASKQKCVVGTNGIFNKEIRWNFSLAFSYLRY